MEDHGSYSKLSAGDHNSVVGSTDSRGRGELEASDLEPPWNKSHLGPAGTARSNADFRILPGRVRHKKGRVMRWVVLEAHGERRALTADKRQLAQIYELDIPVRDLRLMEVAGTKNTPGQLLPRDRSVMVCMEQVRLIITADKVLLPVDDEHPNVPRDRFLAILTSVLADRLDRTMDGGAHAPADDYALPNGRAASTNGPSGGPESVKDFDTETLPFELAVLETALGEVCDGLSREAGGLFAAASPALEDLMRVADTANLERVRRIKTGHQRLTDRLTSVRDAIKRVMEDDEDMWRLCLTRKRQLAGSGGSNSQSASPRAGAPGATGREGGVADGLRDVDFSHFLGSAPQPWPMLTLATSLKRIANNRSAENLDPLFPANDISRQELNRIEQCQHDLLDVENLLESYFLSADSTLQQLRALGEYIDDTEDLINIQLDFSRNKLIRIDLLLTIATFALAFCSCIAGILGENLVLPDAITQDLGGFIIVNGSVFLLVGLIFGCVYWYLKQSKVM